MNAYLQASQYGLELEELEEEAETQDRTAYAFEKIEQIILQISWLGQRQFMQLLDQKQFGITLPQFYTLLHLYQMAGECKMSDLADATHQSAASLTGVVDRLLSKRLVERTRHNRDRRQVMVILTQPGRLLIEEIKHAQRQQLQIALSHMQHEDMTTLHYVLNRTLEGMQRALDHNTCNGDGDGNGNGL